MTDELPFAAERNQRRAGDQAPVALGETGAFPDLAEQNPFAEINQAWNDVADLLARRRRLRLSHGFLLIRSSGWIHCDRSTRLLRRARRNVSAPASVILGCGRAQRVPARGALLCRGDPSLRLSSPRFGRAGPPDENRRHGVIPHRSDGGAAQTGQPPRVIGNEEMSGDTDVCSGAKTADEVERQQARYQGVP